MHFSTALAAVAAVVPLVNAHDEGPALPRINGLHIKDLKARDLLSNLKARAAEVQQHEKHESLKPRQGGTNGQCGGSFGSCSAGYCCSESGWCGNTADYCYSPGCQYAYGPACPENATPAGTNTSTVARTKVGSVAYGGAGIYECVTPGTVALTYDDGPQVNYTDHILDIFKSYNAKATFFITGNNLAKGEIDTTASFVSTIQRMNADGHQIASHTWTHLDLSAISAADRANQMYKNEMALRNILGFFPTYMRPPYSSCDQPSGCETAMANLGYHVIYFDVDTDDYEQDAPNLIQNSKNWFRGNITAGGATASNSEWLSISHDIHAQTAYNLTDYMLSTLTTLGYKAVTVGECLGDPSANWYRSSSSGGGSTTTTKPASSSTKASSSTIKTSSTVKPSSTTVKTSTGTTKTSTKTSTAPSATATKKVSTDATCGGTNGYTCLGSTFGNCCSVNGWCGSTSAYCGTGCQSAFGTCGTSTATSTAPAPTGTKKVSTDGTCAGTAGQTCQGSTFGNCCSQYGWCGSTTGHCGTGCQASYGTCS